MKGPMCKLRDGWREKLAAFHPDDLSPSECAELEAHVANCPLCSAIRAEYRLMDTRICSFPSPEFLLSLAPPPLKLDRNPNSDV